MNITVVLPSLNPDEKLMLVVNSLLEEGFRDIVIINDGSDASHLQPFRDAAEHPEVTVLTHEQNRGKGRAMKTAFAWCLQHRPDIDGVVTVDGDNQHKPKDVRACAEAMLREPERVWLGVRDFSLDHVPPKSRAGNTITRWVMRFACGVSVSDTQTGLRAIAAEHLPLMCEIPGERYEYETQMLIDLRKARVRIGEVIIETVYIEKNESSHFHPFRDSWIIYKILLKYLFSSLVSTLIDLGVFTLLNTLVFFSLSGAKRLLAATAIARLCSSLFNYTLNHKLVFRSKSSLTGALPRYYALCLTQVAASYGLVYLLSLVLHVEGLLVTVVKVFVDFSLFLLGYRAQQEWVFPNR